jgi:hypothetical protein
VEPVIALQVIFPLSFGGGADFIPNAAQSPACISLVRPLRTQFGRYVLFMSISVLQKKSPGG